MSASHASQLAERSARRHGVTGAAAALLPMPLTALAVLVLLTH